MKKRYYIIGIIVGVLIIALIVVQVSGIFNSPEVGNELAQTPTKGGEFGNFGGPNQPIFDEAGNQYYPTYTVFEQEPVSLSGVAQLNTDSSYFYNPDLGDIIAVHVVDQQTVKKGDPLYTYSKDNKELQYEIEDNFRAQTRLYNQRIELIDQLSELTSSYYNYQGDLLGSYWGEDGQLYYYVVETLGKGQGSGKGSNGVIGEPEPDPDPDPNNNGTEEPVDNSGAIDSLKDQIREVNTQIEDLEIAMSRLQDQEDGVILAQFDGKAYVNPDGKTNSGVPLVRIVSDDVSITGTVTEYEFFALGEDLPVNLFVNAENRDVPGTMIAYDRFLSTATSTDGDGNKSMGAGMTNYSTGSQYGFTIKPEDYIQPGFSVKIQVFLAGLSVPQEAIMEEGPGNAYVFVYRDGIAYKQTVQLKQQGLQRVVTSGLNSGDMVIYQPYELQDGQPIQIDQDYYQQMMDMQMGEDGGNIGAK